MARHFWLWDEPSVSTSKKPLKISKAEKMNAMNDTKAPEVER